MVVLKFCPKSDNVPRLLKGSGNYWILDRMRVRLFPNFTCHHLIAYTVIYCAADHHIMLRCAL